MKRVMKWSGAGAGSALAILSMLATVWATAGAVLEGVVQDAASDRPLAARLYLEDNVGRWFFATSASPEGSAIRYERRNWINTNAVEYHTTLSAHPFRAELPPGRYTITIERGKEYRPLSQKIAVEAEPLKLRFRLHRWIDMAARGWFSGDTHVHRTAAELPNLLLAEDLNVAFPLTYWVTQAFTPPTQGDKNVEAGDGEGLVTVDPTHVFWPRNTEYEIFSVSNRNHTLGAVFVLGHQRPFQMGAPPVGPIAEQARREGALLDLDKHDWPWSMALVPAMGVDLYELANNHHWRTEFGINRWSTPAPEWMELGAGSAGGTEQDWTMYTFKNYYALLNCGFRLRPTAGTANGVHPVPLGFGRVYVHLPNGFNYGAWLQGLNAGHSFVTTGPMLLAEATRNEIRGSVISEEPVREVEIIVNGAIHRRLTLQPEKNAEGAWEAGFRQTLQLDGTSWVAARCFEPRPNSRFRFAHTAPRWFEVADAPLRPRKHEVEFLAQRVRNELRRSAGVLPAAAIAEYRQALAAFENLISISKP